MKSIYKYLLEPVEVSNLTLRGNVLSVGAQGEDIMVWAVHDDAEPERQLFVDEPESSFVGTVFLGPFVFHVFATA